MDEFGADVIVSALDGLAHPTGTALTICTAHKSKGLEWGSVRLAGDFPGPDRLNGPKAADELRLLYVAVTRARFALDVTLCPSFAGTPVPATA